MTEYSSEDLTGTDLGGGGEGVQGGFAWSKERAIDKFYNLLSLYQLFYVGLLAIRLPFSDFFPFSPKISMQFRQYL